ncbi:class IV adenylate cyclase [Lipingzhangella sp. LS1_29]|uniref:Class IV adenylate cyclase n=1 Tax=Lipingzhangella rawalii TaxID=2055835 RepID=A0ABU2HDP2_9ACTN|nr:class IV adenylate cyclase [Lipingzhangella rawalii]MDS1272689.1 class IV adenylate cyclase [Lipingzhangella rawalii]
MGHTSVEYEAKILDIDPDPLIAQIQNNGGVEIGKRTQRRYVYDIDPNDQSRWIRLRDTGDDATLAIKEIDTDAIGGTRETEVTVSDIDTTNVLLSKLGYRPKAYQENHRHSFILNGACLEIDSWPLIPPYLEIEADTREDVVDIAKLLGYDETQLTGQNTTKIYAHYGIDLATITDLRFPENA